MCHNHGRRTLLLPDSAGAWHAVLQKIQTAGVTLNKDKCEFNRYRHTFLGHVIDGAGVSPNPSQSLHWRSQ